MGLCETYKINNCTGCPEAEKDFCEGVKYRMKIDKAKSKDYRRSRWETIIDEMKQYFKNVNYIGNDSYILTLPSGKNLNYYPTTGTLMDAKTKWKTEVSINDFKRYFQFLVKE